MEYRELSPHEEETGKAIVNAAFNLHKTLGPGLLEKIHEVCMAYEFRKTGLNVKRQVYIPIVYDGIEFDEELKLDLLVDDLVVIELKAVDIANPVWQAQIISHLKLTHLIQFRLPINFNVPLIKDGIRRFRN